jgi:hypothetical protein
LNHPRISAPRFVASNESCVAPIGLLPYRRSFQAKVVFCDSPREGGARVALVLGDPRLDESFLGVRKAAVVAPAVRTEGGEFLQFVLNLGPLGRREFRQLGKNFGGAHDRKLGPDNGLGKRRFSRG